MDKITLKEETSKKLERSSESQKSALDTHEHRGGMNEIEVDDDIGLLTTDEGVETIVVWIDALQ